MKSLKLLLIILVLCTSVTVFSQQEKYETYIDPYKGGEHPISIVKGKKGKFSLLINAVSFDSYNLTGGLMIPEKQLPGFLQNIGEAKVKYEMWIKTAKENNVTDLSKEIPIESKRISGYFYYGDKWMFDYSVYPTFQFWVHIPENSELVNYYLIIRTGKLISSSNEYINCKGYGIVFTNPEEATSFGNMISSEKINEFINSPKDSELFK